MKEIIIILNQLLQQDLSPFLDKARVDFSPVNLHCLNFTQFTICRIPRFAADEEPNKHPDGLDPFTTLKSAASYRFFVDTTAVN